MLDGLRLLTITDTAVLVDYCLCWARILQGERALARQGMIVPGREGTQVKNPWTTVVAQYRTQLKAYVAELGLSPSARGRLDLPERPGGDDDDTMD